MSRGFDSISLHFQHKRRCQQYSFIMHERCGTKKKNRKSFMDTIMPTYAMTSKGKSRAALPTPGRQSGAPPLPARRVAPPPPQPSAEEEIPQEIYDDFSEDTDDFPPPSSSPPLPPPPSRSARPLPVPQESQDLYDEFDLEAAPEISPYNPSKHEEQGEIYDEFEEVGTDEVYADPDEDNPPPPPPSNFPKKPGNKAPPLPPMGNRRGSQPLPPPPRATKHEDLPLPAPPIEDDIYDGPDDDDQNLYQEEDDGVPPPPPPPNANRAKVIKPPPRKAHDEKKEKKVAANSPFVPQIGLSALQGAIGKLRKVSDDRTVDDKNKKNEKNQDEKSKDKTSMFSDGSRSEDSNNNKSPVPVLKPLKPKPEIPKLPEMKKEEKSSSVSNITNRFGGVKSLVSDMNSRPDLPSKPKPPAKTKDKEESGVKTVILPKLPPSIPTVTPTVEVVSLPTYEDDDEEIYDDAQTADLDPLSKYAWYHGKINRTDGNARLKSVGMDGTYLVRKSDKDPNQPYTMQVLFEDRVNNLKVRLREDKRFALGEAKPNEITFKDVLGMITHHKVHPVLLIGAQQGEITLRETPKKN
ncbi:histone-lysine N-methyltransferase 2D-like isoform X2 [Haliotis rubra]|uniref:histone-lysine N-methyltransferase 2D-like isoform X2 n=1 Tax=Haliotis rubra TaxID=36100 RepID=UPI001EE5A19B|nr:histone-lysine N-methyltransferase 2D-like isoform X2 [Haliotis rubra]